MCRKETSVEVSWDGEELLLCAGLWEFIASHLKVLCTVSSVIMSWHSGIFQDWDFTFCLLCMRCQSKLIGGAMAAPALSLSNGKQPAWRSGVCLGSVPNLTGCRPCLGDLAGPGRHQHGAHTLCDAHTSCTTTMLCGGNSGIQDLGTSPSALIPKEMLAQPGSLWDSREQVPCSPSALLLPTNSISGSHFMGESTQVVYSCWKGGRGE